MIVRLISPLAPDENTACVIAVDENAHVVIQNMVENVANANVHDNPLLYRQLWEWQKDEQGFSTFQNKFTNTYLCTDALTKPLVMSAAITNSCKWGQTRQHKFANDPEGAPLSYALYTQSDKLQVIDLSRSDTTPGNSILLYSWYSGTNLSPVNIPYHNQIWYLEEPRLQVINPFLKSLTISASDDSDEVIEVWNAMIGGSLLGTITGDTVLNILAGTPEVFISSKRKGINGSKIDESETEDQQIITLSENSQVSVQFYYGDPRKGAKVTIDVSAN